MSVYNVPIPRCTRTNAKPTHCRPPARRRFCYFHKNAQGQHIALSRKLPAKDGTLTLPVLEDANSVRMSFVPLTQLLGGQLDPKITGLFLYALPTASLNLRPAEIEPASKQRAVTDPSTVSHISVREDPSRPDDLDDEDEEDDEEEEDDEGSDDADSEDDDEEYEDDDEDDPDRLHVKG